MLGTTYTRRNLKACFEDTENGAHAKRVQKRRKREGGDSTELSQRMTKKGYRKYYYYYEEAGGRGGGGGEGERRAGEGGEGASLSDNRNSLGVEAAAASSNRVPSSAVGESGDPLGRNRGDGLGPDLGVEAASGSEGTRPMALRPAPAAPNEGVRAPVSGSATTDASVSLRSDSPASDAHN
jgi:hypothetical protein